MSLPVLLVYEPIIQHFGLLTRLICTPNSYFKSETLIYGLVAVAPLEGALGAFVAPDGKEVHYLYLLAAG